MEKVPKQEIEGRTARFQAFLAESHLDGAFILQNADLYYFSGTIQSSVLFIPRAGDPVLMVHKGLQRAREESPLEQVFSVNGRGGIPDALKRAGISRLGHVGMEMDVVPASLYLWYGKAFPECRFEDISEGIRRVRMVKSPYEVDQIRKATRILHKGYEEIKAFIREGMTELEVDGRLSLIARREGHMGILRMRGWNQEMTYAHVLSGDSGSVVSFLNSPHGGSGNTPAMAQGAGFRRIGRNEPIGIDFGVGVNGYLSDQFRTLVIGDIPDDMKRAHDCSGDILRLLATEAKPGTLWSDLYDKAVNMAEEAGLGPFFMGHGEGQVRFIGHGFGLEIDEFPILTAGFHEKLEEGMVMAIEPKFIFPGRGVVGMEDDYLVTSSGLERLTITPQELIHIPAST
ncbi:MAG: aminopeptidase P family protein [Deltaproteobacteria bacterium]|nr:aminopeptidase P family protein [Deltaproteobacteria bacterium]